RYNHGHQDQRAAHGRRTTLDQMRLRAIFTDVLADLVERQPADHPGSEHKRKHHRREHAQNGAKGQKLENAEAAVELLQKIGQVHQHDALPPALATSRATMRSMRALREPLTNTTGGLAA